jgi:hypothetical protein
LPARTIAEPGVLVDAVRRPDLDVGQTGVGERGAGRQ